MKTTQIAEIIESKPSTCDVGANSFCDAYLTIKTNKHTICAFLHEINGGFRPEAWFLKLIGKKKIQLKFLNLKSSTPLIKKYSIKAINKKNAKYKITGKVIDKKISKKGKKSYDQLTVNCGFIFTTLTDLNKYSIGDYINMEGRLDIFL
jgi:hypothetical protein